MKVLAKFQFYLKNIPNELLTNHLPSTLLKINIACIHLILIISLNAIKERIIYL